MKLDCIGDTHFLPSFVHIKDIHLHWISQVSVSTTNNHIPRVQSVWFPFTSVRSERWEGADEQSTKGTRVVKVVMNWNVIWMEAKQIHLCRLVWSWFMLNCLAGTILQMPSFIFMLSLIRHEDDGCSKRKKWSVWLLKASNEAKVIVGSSNSVAHSTFRNN